MGVTGITLLTQIRRKDRFQPFIVAGCALIASIAALFRAVGLLEFIFGYLMISCLGGILLSGILHRIFDMEELINAKIRSWSSNGGGNDTVSSGYGGGPRYCDSHEEKRLPLTLVQDDEVKSVEPMTIM